MSLKFESNDSSNSILNQSTENIDWVDESMDQVAELTFGDTMGGGGVVKC